MASGASGQLYGNHFTWTFDPGWQTELDTIGVTQLQYAAGFFNSVKWYNLIPDYNHTFVISGYGTFANSGSLDANNYVTAELSQDRTLGIAYVPVTNDVVVAMTNFAGPVTAQWFDPGDSNYTAVSGSPFANSGTQTFIPAATNSVGGTDWMLLLEAPLATPQITGSSLSGGDFTVGYSTVLGQHYQLQGITNLVSGLWTSIGTNTPGTGGIIRITNIMSQPWQFYRVVTGL